MKRETLQIGDPRLKAKNQKVTNFSDPKIKDVILDLIETMRAEELIGMAAPQIGENYQIFVTEPRETIYRTKDQVDQLRIYINPKIIYESKEKSIIFEGCGCVNMAGEFGPVLRPKVIIVEAFDQEGKKFKYKADGILGRVIQHECDHLAGIEFVEHVDVKNKMVNRDKYIETVKNSPEQTSASVITIKEFTAL